MYSSSSIFNTSLLGSLAISCAICLSLPSKNSDLLLYVLVISIPVIEVGDEIVN